MACTFNLRADNGKVSNLYQDIAESVTDEKEAVDIYYYTKTDQFKKNYNGSMDKNGEPRYEEFSKEEYIHDIDYASVELGANAEAVKSILGMVPRTLDIIENRLNYLKGYKGDDKKYHQSNIKSLEGIVKSLMEDPIERSIPKVIKLAYFHTKGLQKTMAEAKAEAPPSMSKLANIKKTAEAYEVIHEIKAILESTPDIANLFGKSFYDTRELAGNIQNIKDAYLNASMDYLVEEFHKRDSTWTKDSIRRQLKEAPRDSVFHEQMLEYMGDSSDRVLSMVAYVMREAENNVRESSIKFTKELTEVLEALEKSNPGKGEEIFNKVIIETETGELHYASPEAEFTNGRDKVQDASYKAYQDIKGDRQMVAFMDLFHTTVTKLGSALPHGSQLGTRLPSVLRSDWELLQGKTIKEKGKLIGKSMQNAIVRSNTDMDRGAIVDATGKPVKRIPTFYTQKYNSIDFDKYYSKMYKDNINDGMSEDSAEAKAFADAELAATKEFSKHITRDLSASIQAWHAMATNYAAKNEFIHIFDSAKAVVDDVRKSNVVDSGGRKHYKWGTKNAVLTHGSVSAKRLEKFLDMHLYGQKELDLGFANVFGQNLDYNAMYRQLGNYTSLNMLSLNMLAGLGNFANGEYNNFLEGMGGEFFKVRDLHKATGIYKDHLLGTLEDIGARVPKGFITLMEEKYDFLQSYGGNKIKTTERSKFKRLMKTDLLYFMNGVGEHMMQVRGSMAILENIKTFTKDGKAIGSLLDAHKAVNGELKIDENIYIKNKNGELVAYDRGQQDRVQAKMHAVMRKLHGNYSGKTATQIQQDGRTALIMKFRGWAYEGFMRRWGGKKENHLLEQEMEGFYRSGGRVLGQLSKDLMKLKLQVAKEKWGALTPHEKANVRRLLTEAAIIATTLTGALLLGKAGKLMEEEYDSDSWEDRLVMGSFEMLTYQTNRLYTEVFAYLNPVEAVRLMRSPMASMSIIENTIKLIQQLTDPFEQYEVGWKEGDYKILARLSKLLPGFKQVETLTLNADAIRDRGLLYNMD